MQKDILFYSNLCDFSKEVLNNLVKHQLKEKFLLVSVDNRNLKLPPFVDRVPLIYTADKKLFADEQLMAYIQSKVAASSLQPYSLIGTSTNSYSEGFSFLEEAGEDFGTDSARNYNFVGMDQRIYAPEEGDEQGSIQNNKLESFMANRDNDLQRIYGNKNSVINRL